MKTLGRLACRVCFFCLTSKAQSSTGTQRKSTRALKEKMIVSSDYLCDDKVKKINIRKRNNNYKQFYSRVLILLYNYVIVARGSVSSGQK